MSKHNLEVLFDSRVRLKILKFLFRNAHESFLPKAIIEHTQEDQPAVLKELRKLLEIHLIQRDKKGEYALDSSFEYFTELRDLVLKQTPSEKKHLMESINKLGKIRVAIIAGLFLDKENMDPLAVDLFLVGDYVDRRKLVNFLKVIESEVGKEIRFATMEKEEFRYRLAMFDRFVRVLLEGPHEKLINKMGLE